MDTIERLRQLMQQNGWSEYRLAQEANLPKSTVSNIFHRQTIPSIPTLQILCNAFGITLSQFFDENSPVDFSAEQAEILAAYARLSPKQQTVIRNLLQEMKK